MARRCAREAFLGLLLLGLLPTQNAEAQSPVSSASPAAADAGAPHADGGSAAPESGTCVEDLGRSGERQKLEDTFPEKGEAGYVAALRVVVDHGRGETVLPNGLQFQLGGDQIDALQKAGFVLPSPGSSSGPQITKEDQGDRTRTTVTIPFVALPPKAGRHQLTLPALPIAVSRASGEIIRLCTRAHRITIEEPIANLTDPPPKGNPEPVPQLEEWTLLKHVTYASAAALVLGAIISWLVLRWLRRPRPAKPLPPPRPPWEVALEELHDIRYAGLVEVQRFEEHYDRVSHSMRKYLGGRFGFDGLETTSREMVTLLRGVVPGIPCQKDIEVFLREADLVKFARLMPTQDQCETALVRGESIVKLTMPSALPPEVPRPHVFAEVPPPGANQPPPAPTGEPPSNSGGVS